MSDSSGAAEVEILFWYKQETVQQYDSHSGLLKSHGKQDARVQKLAHGRRQITHQLSKISLTTQIKKKKV